MRLIVVGSGIVGSACACAASRLGAEVTLVDAGMAGQATAAGAGIVCPWTSRLDDPAWYAFGCAAAREYPGLVAGLAAAGEADVSYRQVGALVVTDGAEQQEQARQRIAARRAAAPEMGDVQSLTGAEAQRLFPPLRPDAAAVFVRGQRCAGGRPGPGGGADQGRPPPGHRHPSWPGRSGVPLRAGGRRGGGR
jgi:D-amino-acid dehydrogenase